MFASCDLPMSLDDSDSSLGPSLKDMVTATLQSNGVLGKIQAQLRASVFLTLEEEFKEKSLPLINKRSKEQLSSPVGHYAANLVKDFLECLELEFTLAVFECEANLSTLEESSNGRIALNGEREPSPQGRKEEKRPLLFKLIEELHSSKFEDKFPATNNSEIELSIDSPKHSSSSKEIGEASSSSQELSVKDESKESASLTTDKSGSQSHGGVGSSTKDKRSFSSKEHPGGSEGKKAHTADDDGESKSDDTTKTLENRSSETISGEKPNSVNEDKADQGPEKMKAEEEDLSSLSGVKELPGDEVEPPPKEAESGGSPERDKDEAVVDVAEPAEDIDEDIYVDDLLSSASGTSSATKDVSESQTSLVADYMESL